MDAGTKVTSVLAPLLERSGLALRGALVFRDGEASPPSRSGKPARSAVLIGHVGAGMWPHFTAWRKTRDGGEPDPLDRWSKRVIGAAAETIGARAVFPSDRPYLPFQSWAMRAEGLQPSPLGILMHPIYGLWHGYRGTLLFDAEVPIQADERLSHPCDACVEKPCLSACPVSAFSANGFAAGRCRAHLNDAAGQTCRDFGCLARNACPVGAEYRYGAEQQAFHQRAFIGA